MYQKGKCNALMTPLIFTINALHLTSSIISGLRASKNGIMMLTGWGQIVHLSTANNCKNCFFFRCLHQIALVLTYLTEYITLRLWLISLIIVKQLVLLIKIKDLLTLGSQNTTRLFVKFYWRFRGCSSIEVQLRIQINLTKLFCFGVYYRLW